MNDIRLLNCDCMEYMATCKDKQFDLAIVDPPYGINADEEQNKAAESRIKANGKSKAGRGWKLYKKTEWDKEAPDENYFDELIRISKNQIIWGGNYMTDNLFPSMGWVVWDKGQRDFSLADGELAWTSFDKALRIFTYSRGAYLSAEDRIHPTQKPIKLYKWLLHNYAKEGDKIFDSHGGSMSIAIACHDMNFDLTLCEIDKDYYEAGKKRFENHIKQIKLFT